MRPAREVSRPAWQRNSPKDNIPDLTRRGARQPQDGIARGDVPARDDARGVRPPRPAQPRGASMRPDDARVRANTLGPVRNEQRWKEISPREIGQDGRGAQGDEQGLRVRLRVRVRVQVRPRVRRAGARRQDGQDRRALRHPSSSSPSSSPSTTSGFKEWWAKAGKIDRSTIAALGGAALLSYGLISNIFYVSSLLGAMYSSCKIHAASPLVNKAAMQTFVTTYFGLWMIQNFLRPARMGLSVAISPFTDKIVEFFRRYVPGNRKPLAFGLTVFCVNVLGTFAYMFGGFFPNHRVDGRALGAREFEEPARGG